MALNPETEFPGRITASNSSYPYGSARNITSPGDDTGTPLVARLVNDLFGFQQALLVAAGITPNGNPDTVLVSQYLNALNAIIASAVAGKTRRVRAVLTQSAQNTGWVATNNSTFAPQNIGTVTQSTSIMTVPFANTAAKAGMFRVELSPLLVSRGVRASVTPSLTALNVQFFRDLVSTVLLSPELSLINIVDSFSDSSIALESPGVYVLTHPTAAPSGSSPPTISQVSDNVIAGAQYTTMVPMVISHTATIVRFGMFAPISGYCYFSASPEPEWPTGFRVDSNAVELPEITRTSTSITLTWLQTPKEIKSLSVKSVGSDVEAYILSSTPNSVTVQFRNAANTILNPNSPTTDMAFYFMGPDLCLQNAATGKLRVTRPGVMCNPQRLFGVDNSVYIGGEYDVP